jgi:hypothetical protein
VLRAGHVCQRSYFDWDVSFSDWSKINVALQPTNLCESCYITVRHAPTSPRPPPPQRPHVRLAQELERMGLSTATLQIRRRMRRNLYVYIQMEFAGITLKARAPRPAGRALT